MIGLAPEIPEDLYMLIKKVRSEPSGNIEFCTSPCITNASN